MSLRREEIEEENGEKENGKEADDEEDGEEEDMDGEEEEMYGEEEESNTIITISDSDDDTGAISDGSVQVKKYLYFIFQDT